MSSIADELSVLANTKKEIKEAIISKGVEVTEEDTFKSYADKIRNIPTGGEEVVIKNQDITIKENGQYTADEGYTGLGTVTVEVPQDGGGGGNNNDEWKPNPEWWDIKKIIEEDTENYPGKAIFLLYASGDTVHLKGGDGAGVTAIKTSDGGAYGREFDSNSIRIPINKTEQDTNININNINNADIQPIRYIFDVDHKWDTTKDKKCSDGTSLRYIILYFDEEDIESSLIDFSAKVNFRYGIAALNAIYAVFKCNLLDTEWFTQDWTYALQSFDFCDGYNFKELTDLSDFCFNCTSLRRIPDSLDTSSVTTFKNFCKNCYSLKRLPKSLDTSQGTDFDYFCCNCYSLTNLSNVLDLSNATNYLNFLRHCFSLHCANIKLGTFENSQTEYLYFGWIYNLSPDSVKYFVENAPVVTNRPNIRIADIDLEDIVGTENIQKLEDKGWNVEKQ